MDKKRGKFWFVWNPDGRSPTFHHPSRQSADAEAKRLAENNPGQQFIVLKAVGGFQVARPNAKAIDLHKYLHDNILF